MISKEEREAVLRVLERGTLSDYQGNWSEHFYGGEEIKALEKEWADYFGVKHAIAVNSATSGLWAALVAIGLQQNFNDIENKIVPACGGLEFDNGAEYEANEVIVTPYSMTCSASMPLHFGAKPVFADIEEDYFCLDPKSVEKKITYNTKAIIVVDLFGQPYDADAINEIAERKGKEYGHKIYVIEDAAQAIGAKYKDKYAGTLGDIGVYSLNRHKHIQTGEGGMIVTNDHDLALRLRLVINHSEAVINDAELKNENNVESISWYKDYTRLVGMNLRMTEIQAAIAREQLKKLDGILKEIRDNAKYFNIKVRPECEHAYYRYTITNDIQRNFDKVPKKFRIEASQFIMDKFNYKYHYITPIYKMPLFRELGYKQDQCPVCEKVEENIVLAWSKETP
ncbi:MAG: DegT/DnrJ/EryC1/StrS family aminotransferase [Promethearchaeota archaeon]